MALIGDSVPILTGAGTTDDLVEYLPSFPHRSLQP